MDKENNITTAANSRIMNAVEDTKLFAAAGDIEPVIDFKDGNKDLRQPGTPNKPIYKNRKKQKNKKK